MQNINHEKSMIGSSFKVALIALITVLLISNLSMAFTKKPPTGIEWAEFSEELVYENGGNGLAESLKITMEVYGAGEEYNIVAALYGPNSELIDDINEDFEITDLDWDEDADDYRGYAQIPLCFDGRAISALEIDGPYTVVVSVLTLSIFTPDYNDSYNTESYNASDFVGYIAKVEIPAATPSSGSFLLGNSIVLETSTSGADIYYTLDGSAPTASSTLYTLPIPLNSAMTLKAIAVKTDLADSAVLTENYLVYAQQAETPAASPGGGDFENPQTITLSCSTLGSIIRYTLNGSEPTCNNGIEYTGPVSISNNGVILKAKAFTSGLADSTILCETYYFQAAMPVADLMSGNYESAQSVSLSTPTLGSQIRYTLDGSEPDENSDLYLNGTLIPISKTSILRAKTMKTGMTESDLISYGYIIGSAPEITAPALATGTFHGILLNIDGTVWTWGANILGQLGDHVPFNINPLYVKGLENIVALDASGWGHNLALDVNGKIWAWGYNGDGQLGDNSAPYRETPMLISGLSDITAVAAGYDHSLAIKNDGSVWAWGCNGVGQLGDNTTTKQISPVRSGSLSNIISIAAGEGHSLALESNGILWAWGYNGDGELGDGSAINRKVPVQVSSLGNVKTITAGERHNLAIKNDNTVWAWGNNQHGQLGDGSSTNHYVPVQILSLDNVKAVAAGSQHSLVLKGDGTVWAFGGNSEGQLGDTTYNNRTSPVKVSGLEKVILIAASGNHSFAVKNDGTLWAWGNNEYAQQGRLKPTKSNIPVKLNFVMTLSPKPVKPAVSTINCTVGKEYNIPFVVQGLENVADKTFRFTYDPNLLLLVDLAAQTKPLEVTAGLIAGTDIEIISVNTSGEIIFKVHKTLPFGKSWTGTITIFKFKATATGFAHQISEVI